jgi:hypothetical protein
MKAAQAAQTIQPADVIDVKYEEIKAE